MNLSAPDINEISTFIRVVRQGSLAGAARELGIPKSTVSRRVARLEEQLKTELLHRGGPGVVVTSAGKRLYDSVACAVDTIELAVRNSALDSLEPRGPVRMTAPADFGRLVLLDELMSFAVAFPHITVELELTDRFIDIAAEGFDLAVRAGSPDARVAQNLISRQLGRSELHLAGNPELAAKVSCITDLERVPFVLFRAKGTEQILRLRGESGRVTEVRAQGRFVVHDYAALAELVARGAGLGLLPAMHIDRGASGSLVRVLPELSQTGGSVAVVYPTRRLPLRVKALVEHLTARLGQWPA